MNNEEQVVWSGTPSQITNLSAFIWSGLFCWLIVPLFIALYRWLSVKCHEYELTTQRLKVRIGILAKHNEQLELYRVKDISVQEPLLLRLFSLGNIVLETSDKSTPIMVIKAIPNAKLLGDQIRKYVEQLRDSKRVREVDFQ